MHIVLCLLEAVFLLLYILCEIRKSHYRKTEAEIIDYHIDRESLKHWFKTMIITYRYFQDGIKYTGCEEVCFVTRKKLAETRTCHIYVNPHNGIKFVTPFQISMWRTLALTFMFLIMADLICCPSI